MTEPFSLEDLRSAVGNGLAPDYLFFWGHTSRNANVGKECLSQWYPAPFAIDGLTFPTAEHYMMHRKALLFGDARAASSVLAARDPAEAKQLGRHVRDFDEGRWRSARFDIVVAGNLEKFSQNPAARDFLLGTGGRVLVEASPRDKIWGIGLAEADGAARDVNRWRGLNLLGFALMRVRQQLRNALAAVG